MKRVSRFIIGMIICVAVIAAFTPLAPSFLPDDIAGALAPETAFAEDGGYTLTCEDGNNSMPLYYYLITPDYPSWFENGNTFTVTENGTPYVFTYNFNTFYDENDLTMKEHGYALKYAWIEDYDLYGEDDPLEHIGRTYSFVYFIYRVNADGEPVDAEGNTVDNIRNAEILAVTDPIGLTSIDDHIETTLNGILYYAEWQEMEGSTIISADKEIVKGALKIPSKVNIEGKDYPVREITASVFSSFTGITSLSLPKSIVSIGDYAFAKTGLKKVEIPATVTEIGDYAFGFDYGIDQEAGGIIFKKVPGFVIYAIDGSVADDYAYENGITIVTDKSAKTMKTKAKAKALKKRKVRVTWAKKKYATGYQIYKSNKKNGKYRKVGTIKKNTTLKWTSRTLTKSLKGRYVYYKVRPYTKFLGKTYYGKMSAPARAKVRK